MLKLLSPCRATSSCRTLGCAQGWRNPIGQSSTRTWHRPEPETSPETSVGLLPKIVFANSKHNLLKFLCVYFIIWKKEVTVAQTKFLCWSCFLNDSAHVIKQFQIYYVNWVCVGFFFTYSSHYAAIVCFMNLFKPWYCWIGWPVAQSQSVSPSVHVGLFSLSPQPMEIQWTPNDEQKVGSGTDGSW